MHLAKFINTNMEQILDAWEAFARTMHPAADTMTRLALQDHAKQILQAIARDIESDQTDTEQSDKSKGLAAPDRIETAATTHGALRHVVGFDVMQVGAEFRALRASVLKLWSAGLKAPDAAMLDEMIRFNEAIDQALAESLARYAEEIGRSRATFLAILGHDLRSPLSAITMSAAFLARSKHLDGDEGKSITRIQNSARNMGQMIRDLLDYTRRRLGRGIPVTPVASDIGAICQEVIDEAKAAHPSTVFEFETSGDLTGTFDSARLQQVLSNLLNNAVQHGAKDRAVVMTARAESATVSVQVKNYGTPIPPDALQVIFDPMVQLKPESNEEAAVSTSLGLGLYIAREIVIAHGGTIRAESSAIDGTIFTAELPRDPKLANSSGCPREESQGSATTIA